MRELTKAQAIEAGCDEYTAKRYHVFQLDAGELVEIEKPGIARALWYDDETPNPAGKNGERKREAFMAYNLEGLHEPATAYLAQDPPYGFQRKLKKPYLIKTYYTDACYGPIRSAVLFSRFFYAEEQENERERYGWSRDLSKDEIRELAECEAVVRAKYEKRLNAYWKRYSDKVYTRGYWANR